MSNTEPTSSRGTEASDGSHFTIEDAGSTTDPTDLFENDTTASGRDVRAGGSGTADEVAAAGAASGPGTQADPASSTSAATGAVRSAGSPAAVPVSTGGSDSGPAVDATASTTQEPIPGSQGSTAAGATGGAHEATTAREATSEHDATPEHRASPSHQASGSAHDSRPLADDESIAHVFDQTNGVIEGIEGDSDGTAAADGASAAERDDR